MKIFRWAAWLLPAILPAAESIVPVETKPAQASKYVQSVGHRAAILGHEDGTFEAWLFPVKLLRDFRLSVYFDGALEPSPLSELAETVQVHPGHVTITHSHAAFTIRQTWIASISDPYAALLLEVDTSRPLRLRASFVPEWKPMWPASFGGQSTSWSEEDHALVFTEGTRRFRGMLGSPEFGRHSEQIGHQLPDRTVMIEMEITPERARRGPIPIVMAAGSGPAETTQAYRAALQNASKLVPDSDRYYEAFAHRTLDIQTPNDTLNQAFRWAKYALERGWACNDGVGCGLVAGYNASGLSERPGFGWYFGGDALMNSWSILDYGDLPRVREVLLFLRNHQRADGKMMHEWTQSAELIDWPKYPYGYYHAETTPLYLYTMAQYVQRSGDVAFLRESWDSIERAYRLCRTIQDPDGLLSNQRGGAGAVETGALSGKVSNDVYLQGAWLAGLQGYVLMSQWMKRSAESASALAELGKVRQALNGWFQPDRGHLAFGRLTDGSMYSALSGWQGLALAVGGLDQDRSRRAADSLNRPTLSTDWGVRLFATDSPYYDPLSYNDGSVWPFVNAFVTLAEFRHHRAAAGWQHLFGAASMTGRQGVGYISEYFSGDRAQALPRAVPHQLFSASAVVYPLVSGLLGLEGDAMTRVVRFAPHVPDNWPEVSFERYRVGPSILSGRIRRPERGKMEIALEVSGPPVELILDPAFPAGTSDLRTSAEACAVTSTDLDVHCGTHHVIENKLKIAYTFVPGNEVVPVLVVPQPGERSRAPRNVGKEVLAPQQ